MEDLYITVEAPEALAGIHLSPEYLKQNGTHLFIKSHEWGTIHVDVTEDIPMGCLKHISDCGQRLDVNVPTALTDHTVELLAELYPDLSGKIRKAYLFGGDVREVLP